ncbi:threonine ammonia-lyase [Longispora fulva]|uniref:Threonine dehydratase n=1 Tax=Longispora fulva TaxID=619741 RepID=A0A8J7KGI3_9ACTN|nr:pyridoxal-phosphate dependent enzyme [Longispora fulva]MBG6137400.1 threonine dehydratase [Longispora fulva]
MATDLTTLSGEDVCAAGAWLAGRVVRTPVVRSAALDALAGARLWLKAENLQRGGSYKYRGATLAVGRIADEGRHTGVIAQSTGNHAVAVALAARERGLRAVAVLPVDAAPAKIALAHAAGADVMLAGHTLDDRLAAVERLRVSTGHAVLDAYDHPDVIRGQGTATLELLDEVRDRGARLDAVVLPVGGGGGLAGACLAAEGHDLSVYGVEPVGNDSLARSLVTGNRVTVVPGPTLADGLRPAQVGRLPFRIVQHAVAGVVRVDDAAIAHAVRLVLFEAKLLVEPSAAAALAGALLLAAAGGLGDIGVVLTGGNIDPGTLGGILAGPADVTGTGGRDTTGGPAGTGHHTGHDRSGRPAGAHDQEEAA